MTSDEYWQIQNEIIKEINDNYRHRKNTNIFPYYYYQKNMNHKQNYHNLIINELKSIFGRLRNTRCSINPENPEYTFYILNFVRNFDDYKQRILNYFYTVNEFKSIAGIMEIGDFEIAFDYKEFITVILNVLKITNVSCSNCGNKIHNKKLIANVLKIRWRILRLYKNFSIEIPVYCCRCFIKNVKYMDI